MDAWGLLQWDWLGILKTVIGAGAGTALVQPLLAIYRDRGQRSAQAAYMAMRLSVLLESYAASCATLIQANAYAERHPDSEFGHLTIDLPEMPAYPEDNEGWRAIDRKLAGRCLGLRNKIAASMQTISSVIEFDDSYLDEVVEWEVAERGREAWEIAAALRKKHSIEEAEVNWNYADWFDQRLARILEKRRARSARRLEA